MSEVLDQLQQDIQAHHLFRAGQGILVAVSGGVDSMVLLHSLHRLARQHRWRLAVAHLNHQLRGRRSEADERLVRRAADQLGLPVVVESADVREFARRRKLSLEMAARELRHAFLARTAARLGIRTVTLAQHADDQIELFFLRLLRGSGGEGLAGMKWRSRSPADRAIELVRPFLSQPKKALRECAAAEGIRYREDASNSGVDFQRNRIRHELLPVLRRRYQPALDKTIPRVMAIVGAEAEFAVQAAREWLADSPAQSAQTGASRVRRARLMPARKCFEELPVAVQRRCVQLQLVGEGIPPDFELVEQLRLNRERPVAVGLAAGLLRYAVRDREGRLQVRSATAAGFEAGARQVRLHGRAGAVEFDGVRVSWRIARRRGRTRPEKTVRCEYFDADKVGADVVLRHWHPGDRFQPIGMGGSVKLQDFFTNQKVPRGTRRKLIVAATAGEEVFWVEGMRISERFKLSAGTNRRLQWRWKRL